tara:strand:- start:719 stop:1291 length:573 start_codon:yes stop_codon:yes gene_type:complete
MIEKATIYKLTSKKYPSLIYIGSTKTKLKYRLSIHIRDAKNFINQKVKKHRSSCRLVMKDDIEITSLEICNINNRNYREQIYIIIAKLIYKNGCLNKCWALFWGKPFAHRNWKNKNPIHNLKYNKKYRENNKEKIKKWRIDNYEIINKKRKEKLICECGSIVKREYLTKHKKTKKHQLLLERKNEILNIK